MSDNYPPGVTGSEEEIVGWKHADAWEAWVANLKIGDAVLAYSAPATVTAITDDFCWVRVRHQADTIPVEWEDIMPVNGFDEEGDDAIS